MGEHNAWHFYHLQSEVLLDCDSQTANESALHKIAKEIIANANALCYPAYYLDGKLDSNCNFLDKRQCQPYECFPKGIFEYSNIELETSQEGIVPDLILSNSKGRLCVEIAVTHFVDNKKYQKTRSNGLSMLEIDISSFYHEEELDRTKLAEALLVDVSTKKWIYNAKDDEYLKKLQNRNLQLNAENANITRGNVKKYFDQRNSVLKKDFYMQSNNTRDDSSVNMEFRVRTFYKEAISLYKGIPRFFDIPVKGAEIFGCDRRIWQMYLFDKLIYGQVGKSFALKDIVYYFSKHSLIGKNIRQNLNIEYMKVPPKVKNVIVAYLDFLKDEGFIEFKKKCENNEWSEFFVLDGDFSRDY